MNYYRLQTTSNETLYLWADSALRAKQIADSEHYKIVEVKRIV